MKNKVKPVTPRDAFELAGALGLTPADAVEIVKKHGLTLVQVAKLAETSRIRVTAILNRNTNEVSTDLPLRILARLG